MPIAPPVGAWGEVEGAGEPIRVEAAEGVMASQDKENTPNGYPDQVIIGIIGYY